MLSRKNEFELSRIFGRINNPKKKWKLDPTWIIAIFAIVTSISTTIFMYIQSNEMERATDLAWRPYCDILKLDSLECDILGYGTDPVTGDTVEMKIENYFLT